MILNRSLSFRLFREIVEATALMTAMVFLIVMAATVFSFVFIYLDGSSVVTEAIHGLGLGRWGTLLFILGLIFVMGRSEEHTSELQSLMRISYAVFCLKKKKSHHPH